jgi:hypothetical protein
MHATAQIRVPLFAVDCCSAARIRGEGRDLSSAMLEVKGARRRRSGISQKSPTQRSTLPTLTSYTHLVNDETPVYCAADSAEKFALVIATMLTPSEVKIRSELANGQVVSRSAWSSPLGLDLWLQPRCHFTMAVEWQSDK